MTASVPGPFSRFGHLLYGPYALLVFAIGVLLTFVMVSITPGADRRRRYTAAIVRRTFVIAGAKPRIAGLERLPEGPCVIVANHASYIDGLLLKGFLPPRFSFVIKGEMRSNPLVHFLLRRAGARFVERGGGGGTSRDIRAFVRAAQEGAALGFFPEGTFVEEPGVLPFRPGAFLAAIKAGLPVVPIAIRGTRRMLPAGRGLPRPSRLRFDLLTPIRPGDAEFADSRALADAARGRIIGALDEPGRPEPGQNVALRQKKSESTAREF